jgi:hypothetical protein
MPYLTRIKPGGVGEYFDPLGIREVHASTCAHCQRITEFASMRVMHQHVDICRACMKLICLECAGKPCRPWEKELERQEAEARLAAKVETLRWRD